MPASVQGRRQFFMQIIIRALESLREGCGDREGWLKTAARFSLFTRQVYYRTMGRNEDFYRFEGTNVRTAPQIAAAIPPSNSHRVLSVGVPVNVRDRLELAEFEASIP